MNGFKTGYWVVLLVSILVSCTNDNREEEAVNGIQILTEIERFDQQFFTSDPDGLSELKGNYPFLFPEMVHDSVWMLKMTDSLQRQLYAEVSRVYPSLEWLEDDLAHCFKHIKYHYADFQPPRVIALTSDVDYRNKVVSTDNLMLIALDTYLGSEHEFYGNIQRYFAKNMRRDNIVSDVCQTQALRFIPDLDRRTLLDEMIYHGKILYFKDMMIPHESDAIKIGYTEDEWEWARNNEYSIWQYLVEQEFLFDTDPKLVQRFINPAPFSKFNLDIDRESPGWLGRYMGWQIVRAYSERYDTLGVDEILATDATELFNKSNYKPPK